jgi:ribosomal protein L5
MIKHRTYLDLTDFELINKFNFTSLTNIPKLERLILTVTVITAEELRSLNFPKTKYLLELLTGNRAFIKNFSIKGKIKKQIIFSSDVYLREDLLINFIYFYFNYVFLELQNKFLSINKKLSKKDYSFTIKDISIFPGIAENFLKWSYPLHFSFQTNSKNIEHCLIIFRNLSFDVK